MCVPALICVPLLAVALGFPSIQGQAVLGIDGDAPHSSNKHEQCLPYLSATDAEGEDDCVTLFQRSAFLDTASNEFHGKFLRATNDQDRHIAIDGPDANWSLRCKLVVETLVGSALVAGAVFVICGQASSSAEKNLEKDEESLRTQVCAFMKGRTVGGKFYDHLTILLIVGSIVSFVLSSLTDRKYNVDTQTKKYVGPDWGPRVDYFFFGSEELAGTSIFEIATVAIFVSDYLLRFWTTVEDSACDGSRAAYVFSFFSFVDLASILPFFVDLCTPTTDMPASQFLRMFRLFRMMRLQGHFTEAFTLIDDVVVASGKLLPTAGFVGAVAWLIASGFYYVAERKNRDMIYCPSCPNVDVGKCHIDVLGMVDCTGACDSVCWNLFQSIPCSMYFTLLNLFGEFGLTDRQSVAGKFVAVLVSLTAVFVFAIPTGIIGNGFDQMLAKRREQRGSDYEIRERPGSDLKPSDAGTLRASLYNFSNGLTDAGRLFENFSFALIILSTFSFFLETVPGVRENQALWTGLDAFELFTVCVFTVEFILRLVSIGEEPSEKYAGFAGFFAYAISAFAIIDMLSIAPYWICMLAGSSNSSTFVRALRLLRLFQSERYVKAFRVFDDVLYAQADILAITGFAALILWIFFSVVMYFLERDNPDPSTAMYYKTIPDSMWITLLNLSGECPLTFYSIGGQFTTAFIGVVAVGFIGIPIGVLGAGFQDWVADHAEDTPDETPDEQPETCTADEQELQGLEAFVEGKTRSGFCFEMMIFALIFTTIIIAMTETVPSLECGIDGNPLLRCRICRGVETLATLVFSAEYAMRVAVGPGYFFTFYSLVDLLAIVPWYLAAIPGDFGLDQHCTFFLMFRILRLFKLDKYIPSLSLIDNVFRLKRNILSVTCVVAGILWIIFASLLYMVEKDDTTNSIDPIPWNGCSSNCTQADRWGNAFEALPFTFIHLTGDYPIIEYTWVGRLVCFFMVIAGVGVVSIPSGIIADGFSQIVSEQNTLGSGKGWYDEEFDKLERENPDAPVEFESVWLDELQTNINALLNGYPGPKVGKLRKRKLLRSSATKLMTNLILVLILANVAAVLLESVPSIGRAAPRAFNVFEAVSVIAFTVEYLARLFSVKKDRLHLYSRWCYMTTFFGIVDLLTILPWYIQIGMAYSDHPASDEAVACFRLLRLFRLFQLEHFMTAFTVLDNVFRRSSGVFLATGLMAVVIWISCAALFYFFERNNPNFCSVWEKPACETKWSPDCVCTQMMAFSSIPDALYYVAIFLGGEWAVVDFTWPGKVLCLFLCSIGIAICAIPVGTLFDSFGTVLSDGFEALDEEE